MLFGGQLKYPAVVKLKRADDNSSCSTLFDPIDEEEKKVCGVKTTTKSMAELDQQAIASKMSNEPDMKNKARKTIKAVRLAKKKPP